MSDNIPDGITRDHILSAIREFDLGALHSFADSTRWDVLHESRRYPPKALIGLAAGQLLGAPLHNTDFKGGAETKCFRILKENGFSVVPKEGTENAESLKVKRPPKWSRDELIVTLDFYMEHRPSFSKDEKLRELSQFLNQLQKQISFLFLLL